MTYLIERTALDDGFIISNPDRTSSIHVLPTGGQVLNFKQNGVQVFEPPPEDLDKENYTSFGNALLFPFPNRLQPACFTWSKVPYSVKPPARHGLARKLKWIFKESHVSGDHGLVIFRFDTRNHPELEKQWPSNFQLSVTHRLDASGLTTHLHTLNNGDIHAPIALGFHPYLQIPTSRAGHIRVPALMRYELTADKLPIGNPFPVSGDHDLQNKDLDCLIELDDLYTELLPDDDGLTRAIIYNQEVDLETVVEFDYHFFNHLAVYTPENRNAICFEPYTIATNAMIDNPGSLRVLAPGETADFKLKIFVRKP